jgi:hypothetical protein
LLFLRGPQVVNNKRSTAHHAACSSTVHKKASQLVYRFVLD